MCTTPHRPLSAFQQTSCRSKHCRRYGTLANLRGYIVRNGGDVIAAVCLTGRSDSATLALRTDTLEALRKRYGQALESWWRETFGYDFSALTESEARYLLRVEDADTIRANLAEAGLEGHG